MADWHFLFGASLADVVADLPLDVRLELERNALWHLLSGDPELVAYGAQHFQIQDPMSYNTLDDLKRQYALEGIDVTITIEELREDARRRFVEELSVRERLEGLSAEEIRAYLEQLERSRPDDENGAAS